MFKTGFLLEGCWETRVVGLRYFCLFNSANLFSLFAKCVVEGEVWGQDYIMQRIVYLRSQDIEAWMVKPLSAGCVKTVVAC